MAHSVTVQPLEQRVEIDEVTHQVVVTAPLIQPLEITAPGPQGPPGTLASYIHEQAMPSDTWTIVHNLNALLNLTVIDSAGTVVEGTVTYTDESQVVVEFSAPFAGRCILS